MTTPAAPPPNHSSSTTTAAVAPDVPPTGGRIGCALVAGLLATLPISLIVSMISKGLTGSDPAGVVMTLLMVVGFPAMGYLVFRGTRDGYEATRKACRILAVLWLLHIPAAFIHQGKGYFAHGHGSLGDMFRFGLYLKFILGISLAMLALCAVTSWVAGWLQRRGATSASS